MSKMCLGTVQFGLNYGINNKDGKISTETVAKIMDRAIECGILTFDTASAYGNSEEVLGEYFKSNIHPELEIYSKLPPVTHPSRLTNKSWKVRDFVEQSIERLGLTALEGYYLHTADEVYDESVLSECLLAKKAGLFKKLGLSVYETEHVKAAIETGIFDLIQIPYNILDNRIDNKPLSEIIDGSDIMLFGRSPFLQGLLMMNTSELPKELEKATEWLSIIDEVVADYSLDRDKLCLQYAVYSERLEKIVLGVDTLEQLIKNIGNIEIDLDYYEPVTELRKRIHDVEKDIIFPYLWRK